MAADKTGAAGDQITFLHVHLNFLFKNVTGSRYDKDLMTGHQSE